MEKPTFRFITRQQIISEIGKNMREMLNAVNFHLTNQKVRNAKLELPILSMIVI